jgi:cell division protease FtsH
MQAYNRAKAILTDNREGLIRIAEALLERESLDAAEIRMLLAGQPLEERRAPKIEPKSEKPPASAPAKVIRPSIPPQEKPAPA